MNKRKFVGIMGALKEAHDLQDKIDELMRSARDNIKNDFMNAASLMINHEEIVIDLLEEIMEDDCEYISWWIYDTVFGTEGDTNIYDSDTHECIAKLKTASDLFDYLRSGGGRL